MLLLTALSQNTGLIKSFFLLHAVAWRIWHTVGIGSILVSQSRSKGWIRHFVRVGEGRLEAWREWQGIYHISLIGCWASFFMAGWKYYSIPEFWGYGSGFALLAHTIGMVSLWKQPEYTVNSYSQLLLVVDCTTSMDCIVHLRESRRIWLVCILLLLQRFSCILTSARFYGDFFFDQQPKLTYSGIYRYLNNPERLIGCAALWGMVLITSSAPILLLAIFSHVCTLLFIQLVERPHMQKLYGKELRYEAGLVKTIKRAFPPPVMQSVGRLEQHVDRVLAGTQGAVEDFLIHVGPKFEHGVSEFVKETKFRFSQYPAPLSITNLSQDLNGYDMRLYTLEILSAKRKVPDSTPVDPITGKTRETANGFESLVAGYGEPIRVKWTAAKNHLKNDWIGLYRIADNVSRKVTRVASMGRWVAVCKNQYKSELADVGHVMSDIPVVNDGGVEFVTGELVFEGDKLFWAEGSYEFRYHHGGKYTVMAISLPFDIVVPKPDRLPIPHDDEHEAAAQISWTSVLVMRGVELHLLKLLQNCFDRDEAKGSPEDVDDEFTSGAMQGRDGEKYARRVVYAVQRAFGVDFAQDVVQADRNVRRLSWRICNAKKVLVSY